MSQAQFWTDEKLAIVIAAITDEKKTATQAAKLIGATKNQVVGKLWRIGFEADHWKADVRSPALPPDIPKGCRWIDADPRQPGWQYCHAPIRSPGAAYCEAHHQRAHYRLPIATTSREARAAILAAG